MTTSLKKQAEALGIEVDGRWSDDTLREHIEQAKKDQLGSPSTQPGTADGPSPEAASGAPDVG